MKKLIFVGGTMGVGKPPCAGSSIKCWPRRWLDGDWCWNLNPFEVTEETKAMAMDNTSYLLRNFLKCSQVEYNHIFPGSCTVRKSSTNCCHADGGRR